MNLENDKMIIKKTKKTILLVFIIICAFLITGSVGFCADNKSKIKGPFLNDIRFARHADKFDRIVFEFTTKVKYEINYNELKNELEIKWKKQITVKKDLLLQKKINTRFISCYREG